MTVAAAPITLAHGLAQLNLSLSPTTKQKLLDYLALVQKWNKVYNLTALRDPQQMLTHHVLDSLAVAPYIAGAKSLLDVGSGAGLPGIPLALALPQVQVTLLDSNQKKAAFLQQAVIELQLTNASVVCERIENIQLNQIFSVIITRAFAEISKFAAAAGHLLAAGGTLLAMKGVFPAAEIAQLGAGFKVSEVKRLQVPGVEAERHLVFLKVA